MKKRLPYFLCAYGHEMRISSRTDSATTASKETFGIVSRVTTVKLHERNWRYLKAALKESFKQLLAETHFDNTGEVLSGFEIVLQRVSKCLKNT